MIDLQRLAQCCYRAGPLEPWEIGRKLVYLTPVSRKFADPKIKNLDRGRVVYASNGFWWHSMAAAAEWFMTSDVQIGRIANVNGNIGKPNSCGTNCLISFRRFNGVKYEKGKLDPSTPVASVA